MTPSNVQARIDTLDTKSSYFKIKKQLTLSNDELGVVSPD